MQRQRCVIGAVVQQANPAKLALGFAEIMTTLKKNFLTSIPLSDVDAWVTLAPRVKRGKIPSLAFTDSVINTASPDVQKMHDLVTAAINPPAKTSTPGPSYLGAHQAEEEVRNSSQRVGSGRRPLRRLLTAAPRLSQDQ